MSTPSLVSPDFRAFVARLAEMETAPQERLTRVGMHLIEGALRVRKGGEGLFGPVERPITKPAEALGEWLRSLEESTTLGGVPRVHEAREAVAAAAEELDQATHQMPQASRLRRALYADALGALDTLPAAKAPASSSFWPWAIASALAGILVGLLLGKGR